MVYVLAFQFRVSKTRRERKKGCRNIRGEATALSEGLCSLQNSTSTEPTDAIPVLRLLDSCLLA